MYKKLIAISLALSLSYANLFAKDESDTLIVYLSRTSNTQIVANMIQDMVGGDVVPIETSEEYPRDYKMMVEIAGTQISQNINPKLKTKIDDMNKYKRVFVGFPIWSMDMPPPMRTFLTSYDFSNKTIISFITHGGYGIGRSTRTLNHLLSNSTILKEFSTQGGLERDGKFLTIQGERGDEVKEEIASWLNSLNISTK